MVWLNGHESLKESSWEKWITFLTGASENDVNSSRRQNMRHAVCVHMV
jgi:hypothetical protein